MRLFVTGVLLLLCSLFAGPAGAQQAGRADNELILAKAQTYMDTVSIVSRDSFYADNPGAKRRRGARMQYWYTRDAAGNLIRIETERRIKSTRYHNTFYLRDGQLYCAEELIAEEAGNGEALSAWSASFVFEKSKLVALSSLGHGKSETDDWNPEAYVPHAFFWAVRSVVLHLQRTLRD